MSRRGVVQDEEQAGAALGESLFPNLFSPLTVSGVTFKNRIMERPRGPPG